MQKIVAKFGGSSLASAAQFRKVADIVHAKSARRYIVASAPGRRSDTDDKVTDLLYACFDEAEAGRDFSPTLALIGDRFREIVRELSLDLDIEAEFELIREELQTSPDRDYTASRGEYLGAKALAAYLGFDFVDAAGCIYFHEDGRLDETRTNTGIAMALQDHPYAVIPGFYGSMPDGSIHTFSRGGSDITGSLVARATHADLYENWTDVPGILTADPHIVEDPIHINAITYRELRELSYMGASVLHEAAVFPVRKANITLNIRDTDLPDDPGTLISAETPRIPRKYKVAGIAGRKGYSAVLVETPAMNEQVGFGARLLNIFARHGASFDHMPTGIDTISVVLRTEELDKARDEIFEDIMEEIQPEHLYIEDGIALIAVVGLGMAYSRGTAARITRALADNRVNIRMIDQGSTEINMIFGVDEDDYETAVRAIYKAIYL